MAVAYKAKELRENAKVTRHLAIVVATIPELSFLRCRDSKTFHDKPWVVVAVIA